MAHWRRVLEPILFMDKAGTLGKDIREDLLNHLLEQGINYNQEADWEKITKLPQFTGTTAAYLQMAYQNMVTHANMKYPGTNKADRTTEMVKKWWDSRESNAGTEAMNERVKMKLREREDVIEVFHVEGLVVLGQDLDSKRVGTRILQPALDGHVLQRETRCDDLGLPGIQHQQVSI